MNPCDDNDERTCCFVGSGMHVWCAWWDGMSTLPPPNHRRPTTTVFVESYISLYTSKKKKPKKKLFFFNEMMRQLYIHTIR